MARFTLEQVRDICYYTMNKQKLTLTVLQPTHFMDFIAKRNNEESKTPGTTRGHTAGEYDTPDQQPQEQ